MTYFGMSFHAAQEVTRRVWEAEDVFGVKRSRLHLAAVGSGAELWATEPEVERRLRRAAALAQVSYTESDQRQVRTILDGFME